MLNIDYKDPRSIYEQIVAGVKELIVKGVYAEDEQLPSVREMSVSLTVNPNTVQKAYRQLESDGYIYSVKGRGCFVASASEVCDVAKIDELYSNLNVIIRELRFLNQEKEKIEDIVENIYKEDKK